MAKKRFDNVTECEGVTVIKNVEETRSAAPAWTIPHETVEKNKAIENNMRLLSLNVARSAALIS